MTLLEISISQEAMFLRFANVEIWRVEEWVAIEVVWPLEEDEGAIR